MLEQVQSLDLLYEKETTSKMMEFKLKYLNSYASLLDTYFQNLNFDDIVTSISEYGEGEGRVLILLTCMIVDQNRFALSDPSEITEEILNEACRAMQTGDHGFHDKFKTICQLDSMPCMELPYIKTLKAKFLDTLIQ